MDGTKKHGCDQNGYGDTVFFCFCMKLFYRKYNLCNMHILMKQPFSRKSDSTRFFLGISGNIRGIILGKAILLLITGGAHIRDWQRRQILFRVSLLQIIAYKFLEKMHCPGTICQCMENFKIDSFFIIADLEKKILFVRNIQPAAWRLLLFLYNWTNIPVFQVEPE